jgi:hypothetical protein
MGDKMSELTESLQLARIKAQEVSDKCGLFIPASVIRQIPDYETFSALQIIHILRMIFQKTEGKGYELILDT